MGAIKPHRPGNDKAALPGALWCQSSPLGLGNEQNPPPPSLPNPPQPSLIREGAGEELPGPPLTRGGLGGVAFSDLSHPEPRRIQCQAFELANPPDRSVEHEFANDYRFADQLVTHSDINLLRDFGAGSGSARDPGSRSDKLLCMFRSLRAGLPHPQTARYDFCRYV